MSKKNLHIERIYMYGDNDHYYIDVPNDFVAYEYDYIESVEHQKHYIYFGKYSKKLANAFDRVIGTSVHKIDDMMLVLMFSRPTGMYIHSREFVSRNLDELKEKFEPFIRQFYFNEYGVRRKYSKEASEKIDRFFNPDLSNEERAELVNYFLKTDAVSDLLMSASKVLSFNGYNIEIATVHKLDLVHHPMNAVNIVKLDLDKLMEDVIDKEEYAFERSYKRMTKDSYTFDKTYAEFKKLIENV